MSVPFYGERYIDSENEDLASFLRSGELLCYDFNTAMRFYQAYLGNDDDDTRPQDRALLACNDRFFMLFAILKRVDVLKSWLYDRCREVEFEPNGYIDLWARYHYKDLAEDTPVLTPTGWRRHGDLRPGDQVFGADGRPVNVVATRRFTDSACRRVAFDNGVSIVCGAGHLWTVEASSRKRVKGTRNGRLCRERVTVETSALSTGLAGYRPVVRAAQPLQLPAADLPIDPYVLGCWLGDGASADGRLTCGDQSVFNEIEAIGYRVAPQTPASPITRTIYGIRPLLRHLGVLNNKHIPQSYMLASRLQRLALLQGLVDTDGHVSRVNRCVTFAQKDKAFAEQVVTLAAGLGFKPRLSPVRSTGTWHVVFQASHADHPCRLRRKMDRLDDAPRRMDSRGWRIHSVMNEQTVPTNCIQVEASDGLYLVGRELIPTHNSTIITFAGTLQRIAQDPETTTGIFSATNKIAKPFLRQIKEEMETNELLPETFPDVFWLEPKRHAPTWSVNDGITVKRRSNPKEATVEAFGLIDGMPTGRHFRRLVYDDLINEKHVTNPEMVAKITERWELSDNLGVGEETEIQTVGTRYSFADTYGIILERQIFKERIYPATDNGRLDGKPVFLTQSHWDKLKQKQRSTISSQMLQNPIAGQENMFKPEWFTRYEVRPEHLSVYIMCDPSSGRTRKSDRTAIAVVGVDGAGNKYLLDGVRHRMSLSERWEALRTLHRKWSREPGVVHLKVGYERFGMQSDLESFKKNMEEEQYWFDIVELAWPREGDGSKKSRVGRLEPDVRLSRFFLPCILYENGVGECYWHIDQTGGKIVKINRKGPTKLQKKYIDAGRDNQVAKPIRRLDEDKKAYDVTMALIEEMLFFPFAPKDDLVDALSRIYDMDVIPPSMFEERQADEINESDWADA